MWDSARGVKENLVGGGPQPQRPARGLFFPRGVKPRAHLGGAGIPHLAQMQDIG